MLEGVRTTLDVDEDVLLAAKQLARQRGSTVGRVLSALARRALQPTRSAAVRNGVRLFPLRRHAKKPQLDLVNRLRDEP
jgi:hypothetical protein